MGDHSEEDIEVIREEDLMGLAELQRHVLGVDGVTTVPSHEQKHYRRGLNLLAGKPVVRF